MVLMSNIIFKKSVNCICNEVFGFSRDEYGETLSEGGKAWRSLMGIK